MEFNCRSRLFGPKALLLVSFLGEACETSASWLNYETDVREVTELLWPKLNDAKMEGGLEVRILRKALGSSIVRGRSECNIGSGKGFVDALNYAYLGMALIF